MQLADKVSSVAADDYNAHVSLSCCRPSISFLMHVQNQKTLDFYHQSPLYVVPSGIERGLHCLNSDLYVES